VYFYIGEIEEAVVFALRAGEAFEREQTGEYRETIIGE
jgi:26S proteasome regulatory subunit N2